MLTEAGATANGYDPKQAGGWDGGLPRHNLRGYTSGGVSLDTQNRLDFRKIVEIAQPVYFPEVGTDLSRLRWLTMPCVTGPVSPITCRA